METRFERLIAQTKLVLLGERLWPWLVAIFCLAGLFLSLSFAGVWLFLPAALRGFGLAIFAAIALYVLFRLARLKYPLRREALQRLDKGSNGLATALDDEPVTQEPLAQGIFAESRRRLSALATKLKLQGPQLSLAGKDPYALRALVVLVLVATAFIAGNEREMRLRSAFDFTKSSETITARMDAWVTPPAYTRLPPMLILGEQAQPHPQAYSVPAGSILRFSGAEVSKLKLDTAGLEALAGNDAERNFKLTADTSLNLPLQSGSQSLKFHVIADTPPKVTLDSLERNARGALILHFKTEDDYGIRSGTVNLTSDFARPLVPAPQGELTLPPENGLGKGDSALEIGDSPWAGAKVKLSLSVTDDAGQTASSEPVFVVLPEKPYHHPVARALIEQRRQLLLQPDQKTFAVQQSLEALLIAPDLFPLPASGYLGIRTAYQRLKQAAKDDELIEIGALLFDTAQGLETNGKSPAEQALQAAKDALREAIKNNASPEEIAKLMKELRAALDAVLKEAAKKPPSTSKESRVLTLQDLQSLLDRLDDSAKSGNKDEAQAMLDMLDELTTAMSEDQQEDSSLDETLNALDDLSRQQQALRDQTFSQTQPNGEKSQKGNSDALQNNQSDLRRKLDALKKQMQQNGMNPEKGLGSADQAMKQAEGALGQGNNGAAVDAQGKAIDALRKQSQALAEEGQNGKQGQGKQGQGKKSGKRDPLGRDSNEPNMDNAKGNGSGTPKATASEKSQQIFKEIQRRLGEANRPPAEKDYLGRLMRNF